MKSLETLQNHERCIVAPLEISQDAIITRGKGVQSNLKPRTVVQDFHSAVEYLHKEIFEG